MIKKTTFLLFIVLPILLSSYAQTQIDKSPTSSTPLEKAGAEFSLFAKDLYYNGSYVNKVSYELYYESSTLNIELASGSTERIGLDRLDGVMLYKDFISGSSTIVSFSKKNQPLHNWTVSNYIADRFFVLLGNLLEAYKAENIKGYVTTQTYEEKLTLLKNIKYSIIEKGSLIKLINTNKQDKDYSKLKKRKGQEFIVVENLALNLDLKTYRGLISTTDENKYSVSNIELEYIETPTLVLEEKKKTQQEKETDSLFAVYNKEHFQTITAMSKKSLEANNQLLAKNGFSFIDESVVMAFTDLTNKKAYGQSYKLEQDIVYTFIVTGVGLKEVSVRYGGKTLNTSALGDDPYFAKVTKPLKTEEDGVSQYILTITAKPNFTKGLMIEVYGDFFQYAYIRRYKKK